MHVNSGSIRTIALAAACALFCVPASAVTYTVTPSWNPNGNILPSTPQIVAHGATTAFTVTPHAGFSASVGGSCPAGLLVGTTYTTGPITANCIVQASFAPIPVTTFTGPTATGSGNAT